MSNAFTCTVELSKTGGITVKVVNSTGNITQTFHLDGTSITTEVKGKESTSTITQKDASVETKVKGSSDTSTVTQKADSVVVTCKTFQVDAEEVKVKSTKDTTHESGAKLTVKSTGDLAISSSAKSSLKSTAAMTLHSDDKIEGDATSKVSFTALQAEVAGSTKLTLKSDTAVAISGLKVDVAATGTLTAGGAMTELGKNMTTIKGQMVQVQGTLTKLG